MSGRPPARIAEVAAGLGLDPEDLLPFGHDKAKVHLRALRARQGQPDGQLVLVTSITPTPPGDGKTTITIGLGDALRRRGRRAIVTLREPSLGPCLGVKGGGTGGGRAQVVPSDDINLHFTGDIHAVQSAHALLAAALDNHLHHGNPLGVDPRQVVFRRSVDMNDRALREIVVGLGGRVQGVPREDGFVITAASEVMAVLCLAEDLGDLKARLGRILVAFTADGRPVTAGDLKVAGAMTALLRDALHPNLVQTLEGTPALVHGGPFANIAHGCNSVVATRLALKLGEIVITEAGFAADLGAEKFFDIKCRGAGLTPAAAVLVATVRALKYHGGVAMAAVDRPDPAALARGMANLAKHVEILRGFGVPVLVAFNRFPSDTDEELAAGVERCAALGVRAVPADVFRQGAAGGEGLAAALAGVLDGEPARPAPLYDLGLPLRAKIETIATRVYGAGRVAYTRRAEAELARAEALGLAGLPVCMAKTQRSLSDDPALLNRPEGFTLTVSEARVSAGAGFVVAITGEMLTMPGLNRSPNAERIDVDAEGRITGLV
jgi:formate--tetrahydrofolate ligase